MLMYKMKAWGDEMTKKNEKIIKGMLSRIPKEHFRKGYIIDNKFLMTDGYIFLVSDEIPNIPLHDETDDKSNYEFLLQSQAKMERSRKIDVSYSSTVIRKWNKPYHIGVRTFGNHDVGYSIGINPIFLSEAMELTQTRTIHIADKYYGSLMMTGNGITIYIMPILTRSETAEETIIKEV